MRAVGLQWQRLPAEGTGQQSSCLDKHMRNVLLSLCARGARGVIGDPMMTLEVRTDIGKGFSILENLRALGEVLRLIPTLLVYEPVFSIRPQCTTPRSHGGEVRQGGGEQRAAY